MKYKKHTLQRMRNEKLKFFTKRIKWYKRIQKQKNDRRYDIYREDIQAIKDIHKGERCFIVGTGPSLNKTNLSLLENETVIGMNTLFNAFDKYNFQCKYYAVSDKANAWMHFYKDILSLNTTLFIGGDAGAEYLDNKKTYDDIKKCKTIPVRLKRTVRRGWNTDLVKGCPSCHSTCSAMCLPIAYYLGFSKVYLLGIDCDYRKQHHFDNVVYGPARGKKINKTERCPELWGEVFREYEIINKKYKRDGRTIINCTVGGRLEVFPRMKLEDIMKGDLIG